MGTPAKIINFGDFQQAKSFSPASPAAGITASTETGEKIANAAENNGLQGPAPTHPQGKLGETPPKKKMKATASQHSKQPGVTPSAGPKGYLHDCDTMSATELGSAYKGEYTSWRLSKSRCKKKDWPWDPAWEEFRDFLRDMGPKADPSDTLDRKNNDIKAYGPDLCRWASKTVQNNNKGNNVKIVIPVTGEVWTVAKLAKLHGVKPKTIYKWIAQFYSPLELLAGKKHPSLLALNTALEELPKSRPTTTVKPPARKIKTPSPPEPHEEWDPTPEELDHYYETGKMLGSRYEEKLAEYEAVVTWVEGFNAGLPVSPEPPQGKHHKFSNPARRKTQFTIPARHPENFAEKSPPRPSRKYRPRTADLQPCTVTRETPMSSNTKQVGGLRLIPTLLLAATVALIVSGARAQSETAASALPPGQRPIFCTEQYEPVCGRIGDNFHIYSNACFARAAGASIVYDGTCKLGHQSHPRD